MLVYAGRFAPEKHLDQLAAAVDRLGAPYRLVAIGAGPAPPRGARVVVLPFIADGAALATALASADAFVHAGDQETFGLAVLEALACGTPAVVRAAEGLAEWVDGRTCLGVGSASAAAFAEAIAALFAADRPSVRAAARERAAAHDWRFALEHLVGHYRRLLDRPEAARAGRPLAAAQGVR